MIFPGSISTGTLREEDLVPAFLDHLHLLDADRGDRFQQQYEEAIASLQNGLEHPYIEHMVPELIEALNECAPKGYRFGAHEGDGADFGFWLIADPMDALADPDMVGETGYRLNAWPEHDTAPCVQDGEHQATQRHPLHECPTYSEPED